MNRQEHLLTCLAEEAGEVVQAVGKALRFGLKDGYPGTDRTNENDLKIEMAQLRAVFMMLMDEGFLTLEDDEIEKGNAVIKAKVAKVNEYMAYAIRRGALVL